MSDHDDLIPRAQGILRANDAGQFTKPAPQQYPHQWNWDAAVIALGLSHFDLPRALTEIRAQLRGQWHDGMVPHIVYRTGPSDYFPDPDFWQTTNSPNAPDVQTSGITQPPVLATVVRTIHARTPILDFVREVCPALLRWHRWLHTARDADGSALACLIHPWESGTDDSPRWLRAIGNITPRDLPPYRRRDTVHVSSSQRPHNADYDRFIHLVNVFRRNRYDAPTLLHESPFLVQDTFVNSILHRADQDLRALALELGEPTDELDAWLARTYASFNARLWNDQRGLYFDYDVRASAPITVNTASTFMALYAGLADERQAQRLINEHWLNSAEYARDARSRFSITSTSKAESAWEAKRYWRGPVWIILNWLLADGLRRYGFDDLADTLRHDSLELIAQSGFWEYFDPGDGSGCGSPDFSWSAALAMEFMS